MHGKSPFHSEATLANHNEANANPANRGGENPGPDVGKKKQHMGAPTKHLGADKKKTQKRYYRSLTYNGEITRGREHASTL